jgi:hypothetical protein
LRCARFNESVRARAALISGRVIIAARDLSNDVGPEFFAGEPAYDLLAAPAALY